MGKPDLTDMDTRVMEFHLRNRNISQADIDAHLKGIDDEAEEGQETKTVFSSSYADRGGDEGTDAQA